MGPFKKFYSQEIKLWLNNHSFQTVTALKFSGKLIYDFASMQTAINGFKKCGIIPFHSLVFEEVDFIPDKSNGNEDHATPMVFTRKEPNRAANVESPGHEHVEASTSRFSPFDLRPPPGSTGPSTSCRSGGKAAVVTFSPYQRDLRESLDKSKKKMTSSPPRNAKDRFSKTKRRLRSKV
jgi:hypothetical protein